MHQAAGAIASAFALGAVRALAGPVARGEQGQVWRLRTTGGTFALKETFDGLEAATVEEAAAFQEAAAAAGVPTPGVVRTTDGAVLFRAGDVSVRVQEWVDLGAPDRRVDPAAVGVLLAQVHNVGFRGAAPLDPWYCEPVGADRWRELAAAFADADGPHAAALTRACDELAALEALVVPPRDLATCHRDLWADNVLPTRAGGLCVVDWDDCGLADRGYELAAVLWEFAADDAGRARRLQRAYLDAGGPGRVASLADFSMLIAQVGHIGEIALATWLEPATPAAERERQVPRIAEFLAGDLTRAHLERLLVAIADA